jgi:polyprenyl-phospho-N-acetylgalactosaminyl synthase
MSVLIDPATVFVIIPAYNENAVITQVVDDLLSYRYKIVVVDDGTQPPLSLQLLGKPIHYLRHRINLGQGAALQTGIEFALSQNADLIVTFDADGQHLPADISKLLNALSDSGADIALGSRFMKDSSHNMAASRKLLLQIARVLNYFFTGLLLTDAHNGLRAMTTRGASLMKLEENRMAHATELLSRIKKNSLKFTEVPVEIRYTDYSRQKGQTVWSSFRIFFDLLLNKLFG